MNDTLQDRRHFLAQLLEAVQRCAFFLEHSRAKIDWPVQGDALAARSKDAELFETLAAINERFAKLQDVLASAMRHSALLMGEDADNFLRVLTFFEKLGVIDSIPTWQQSRIVRNMAAHDYALDYDAMAEHFNTLNELFPMLVTTARRLLARAAADLQIVPASDTFAHDFERLLE